jgi:homocysteine S-methyltransferase
MTSYRHALPQLGDELFLTDGGIETTLIFHEGLELPHFAAFHLLRTDEGRAALHKYFATYAGLARRLGAGLILESPTWRANPDWGERLGYTRLSLAKANREAIELLEQVRGDFESDRTRIVISGCVGPRGDGYVAEDMMSAVEAEEYHSAQIGAFAAAAADMACAITMNYAAEAVGIARAARAAGIPVAISFTVETDGRLPTGQSLEDAVEQVDRETDAYPVYYMVNCAHPAHFGGALRERESWTARVRGLRANASRRSHAELNEALTLDIGDPRALGREHAELKGRLPQLTVLGGCCGTDHRHVEQIALACAPLFDVSRVR